MALAELGAVASQHERKVRVLGHGEIQRARAMSTCFGVLGDGHSPRTTVR